MNTRLLSEHLAGLHRDERNDACHACQQLAAQETPKRRGRRRRGKPTNPCACGCGTLVRGEFAPGHDAKLKSRLINEVRHGYTTEIQDRAREELTRRGWLKFL